MEIMVTALGVRRCHLRAQRKIVRQPGFRRGDDPAYRHRYGYAPGDPAVEAIEQRLAPQPQIAVPTIALQGEADGVHPPQASAHHGKFVGPFERRVLPKIRHNPPREAPKAVADAILELLQATPQ
jgi:pimeloyl-ACP methyl ester carboxylesterase